MSLKLNHALLNIVELLKHICGRWNSCSPNTRSKNNTLPKLLTTGCSHAFGDRGVCLYCNEIAKSGNSWYTLICIMTTYNSCAYQAVKCAKPYFNCCCSTPTVWSSTLDQLVPECTCELFESSDSVHTDTNLRWEEPPRATKWHGNPQHACKSLPGILPVGTNLRRIPTVLRLVVKILYKRCSQITRACAIWREKSMHNWIWHSHNAAQNTCRLSTNCLHISSRDSVPTAKTPAAVSAQLYQHKRIFCTYI